MKKNRIIVAALSATLVLTNFAACFAATQFKDLSGYSWAQTNIESLVDIGAVQGYPDGTYRPGRTVTVAEFVKIAVGLVSTEEDMESVEVKENEGHWAAKYMAYAVENGMVAEGMFDTTDWNKAISRQQMAVIMENTAERVLKEATMDDAEKQDIIKQKISDYEAICNNCKDKVVQAYARGLINGYSNGTFGPTKNANRAEAATMLIRLISSSQRLAVSYTLPTDDLESHVIEKYGDKNRLNEWGLPANMTLEEVNKVLAKYPGIEGWAGGYETKVYDSAKAAGFVLISAEPGLVKVKQPDIDNLVALDKNGNELYTSTTTVCYMKGYGVLKCNLSDIAYFACYASDDCDTYGIYVNDLK